MTFAAFVNQIVAFINYVLVPTIFALAALAFLWGVFQYFFMSNGDAKAQEQGRSFVLWGLVALAVLFSTWGLVNLLMNTIGI
jgi:hypothetical protein